MVLFSEIRLWGKHRKPDFILEPVLEVDQQSPGHGFIPYVIVAIATGCHYVEDLIPHNGLSPKLRRF